MARALFISNPVAARTTARALETALSVLRRAGWSVDVETTSSHGHARAIAEAGVTGGVELLVVQGGDGTITQAAAALVGSGIPLGLIPGGTGNLLAANLRIPRDPARAARALVEGHARLIDLGRLERDGRSAYFSIACGTGIDAVVMRQTGSPAKRRWGMAAYIATILRVLPGIRSVPYRITVDGTRIETEAAMVLVANCGDIIPPYLRLGRAISPEDGILDVFAVRAEGVWEGVRAVWEVLRDIPSRSGKATFIRYTRGRSVTIESDPPEPVEMDGDPDGVTPVTVEVVPRAVRVLTPREPAGSRQPAGGGREPP